MQEEVEERYLEFRKAKHQTSFAVASSCRSASSYGRAVSPSALRRFQPIFFYLPRSPQLQSVPFP